MKTPIYRWSGEYFGFIYNDRLFDKYSKYLGWLDSGEVYRSNGTYLGAIVDENYILRRTTMATKATRATRATPATPATPAARSNRAGRSNRSGYIDALNEY